MREGEGGEAEIPIPPFYPPPKVLAPNGSGLDPRSSRAFTREKEGEARDCEQVLNFHFQALQELCGSCTF